MDWPANKPAVQAYQQMIDLQTQICSTNLSREVIGADRAIRPHHRGAFLAPLQHHPWGTSGNQRCLQSLRRFIERGDAHITPRRILLTSGVGRATAGRAGNRQEDDSGKWGGGVRSRDNTRGESSRTTQSRTSRHPNVWRVPPFWGHPVRGRDFSARDGLRMQQTKQMDGVIAVSFPGSAGILSRISFILGLLLVGVSCSISRRKWK